MEPGLARYALSDFGLSLRFAARRTALRVGASLIASVRWLRPTPFNGRIERILIAPQDLRTSDPTAAGDIYSGYFAFAGKIVSTGGHSPFSAPSPSRAWTEALMGFGWLRDIRAADTALARANARTMVGDWISNYSSPRNAPAWDTLVVSRRLIAWLSHSPLILDGSDRAFYRRFMNSIRRQSAYLWRRSRRIDHSAHRLQAAIALTYVALCTDLGPRRTKRVIDYFIRQLDREILSDGGHISRNPQVIVDILAELLPLRHCFLSQSANPPAELLNAIDRMMPMIRLFRHGDGTLALFNGMSATAPDLIATILAYQDTRSGPTETAGPSGYRRIQGDTTILIMDVGKSPPEAFSGSAHAGCLSFELSDNGEKLIINCGAPVAGQEIRKPLARATAAHSTVVVDDRSSCRFADDSERRYPSGEPIINGPRHVEVFRDSDDDSERITAMHDGYSGRFGLVHKRSLSLNRSGEWLIGEDELQAIPSKRHDQDLPYTIRFHLHPGVEALAREADVVSLTMPSGQFWTFTADAPVQIEESVLFATSDGMRRTTQIVIEAKTLERPTVKWSFIRGDVTRFPR